MRITKITLTNGKVRWYNGPAILSQYTIKMEGLSVAAIEEIEAMQLIDYGLVPAKPAAEVKIGDVIGFNYGHAATVTKIEDVSPAFLVFTLTETGKPWNREKGPQTFTQRRKKTALTPIMSEAT